MSENNIIPSVELLIDKPRRWQLDLSAYELVSDGFEELGLNEYVENPMESLNELRPESDDAKAFKMNRRVGKILRVWIWAGLTGEDPELTLKDLTKKMTVGKIPRLAIEIFPALTESLTGSPTTAMAGREAEPIAAKTSPESA